MANSNLDGNGSTLPTDVRLVVLPENLYQYLIYVMEEHCKQGLHPDELLIASDFWKRVKGAPKIDFSELGKVKMENLSPTQVAISLEHEGGVCEPAKAVVEA
jgi:hypothetical protein